MSKINPLQKLINEGMSPSKLLKTIQSLEDKGIVERYINESGEECLRLTDLGKEVADDIENNLKENEEHFLDKELN